VAWIRNRPAVEFARSLLRSVRSLGGPVASSLLLLWGFLFLSDQVHGVPSHIGHLVALVLAVAFTVYWLIQPQADRRFKDTLPAIVFLLGALTGLATAPWPHLRVLCYAVWMCGLVLWPAGNSVYRQLVLRVAKGTLLAAMLLSVLSLTPNLWLFLNAFSTRVLSVVNGAMGGASVGASASGLVVLLVLGCFLLANGLRHRRAFSVCWVVFSMGLLFIHHAVFQGFATTELARAVGKASYIGIAALVLQGYLVSPTPFHRSEPAVSRRFRRFVLPIAAVAAAVFVAGMPSLWFHASDTPARILLLDHGMLASWSTPSDKAPGEAFRGASFGMLPQHLRAHGYSTETSSELSEEVLQDKDVVIVINPGDDFSKQEKQLLESFVREGNALLAMGDHTDVGGIMRVLNGLLEPFGTGLRFDSAVPAKQGWPGALRVNHPLSRRYGASDVPVSIGASVWVRPRLAAFPLLVGTRAFSDPGDRENTQRALLGNLAYDRGEAYGGIVLATACHWGKGKVVVFGDTQAFQNTGMSFSHDYLCSLIEWMVAGPPTGVPVARAIVALLLLGAMVYFLLRHCPGVGSLALVGACIVVGFFVGDVLTAGSITVPPLTKSGIAYVDLAHNNLVNRRTLASDGLGGLLVNVSRNGYLPVIANEPFNGSVPEEESLIISIAPTRTFSGKDVSSLIGALQSGGTVIISTSWPYARAVSSFLAPLGTGRKYRGQPRPSVHLGVATLRYFRLDLALFD